MKALISILLFILASNSFAEDMRYYDVEVIILENIKDKAKDAEIWPLQVNLNLPEKTIQLGQSFPSRWLPKEFDLKSSYKVLNANTYQLTNEVKNIVASKNQRVIFHTAWRQPGLDKNQSLPIYFKREVADSDTDITPSILEGILRVTLSRYLHLEAELTFSKKIPEIIESENPFAVLDNVTARDNIEKEGVIHLKQKRRRIRSNELHYIDHPVLGILIRMTKYEKPE